MPRRKPNEVAPDATTLPPAGGDEVLNKAGAARLLTCSVRHLDHLVARGMIPSICLGRRVIFRRSALLAALAKLEK